jgi:amino acid permease
MSKHKYDRNQLKKQQEKKEIFFSLKRINRIFNLTEIILIASCFNALFYHFGLDVKPALGAFIIEFSLVFIVYITYKVYNRRIKRRRKKN